ncbi:MAG: DUF2878 domain-containing protein [Planctomycetota bacterium]
MNRALLAIGSIGGWWITVLGAASGHGWLGPACVLLLAALWLSFSADYIADAMVAAAAVLLGAICDGVLKAIGVIDFPPLARYGELASGWMLALWLQMGLSLRPLAGVFLRRPIVLSVVGLISGPLAYVGGAKFGALNYDVTNVRSLSAVAIVYGLAIPILALLAGKLSGATARAFASAHAAAARSTEESSQ